MTPKLLMVLGLVLGMIGVGLIFFWGPPQPDFSEGVGIGLDDATKLSDGRTVAEHDAEKKKSKRRHEIISRFGLSLIFVGFGLQLRAFLSYIRGGGPNVQCGRIALGMQSRS
jgi:hypothetical protein